MKAPPPQHQVRLKFHRATIDARDIRAVTEVLRSGWLTTGPKTVEFERRFAEFSGAKFAVGVTSCTAALHLALLALDISEGDEVITSPIGFASTANMIEHVGAVPVFADVRPDTWNLDPADVERRITRRTRAVVPVHFAGIPCDVDAIRRIARRRGLRVIWDAAHATESRHRGRVLGGLPDCTTYSFYATKNITTGEGGMLTTGDPEIADRVRVLRLHGMSRDAWKRYGEQGYRHWDIVEAGWKYNMFDLQAALGLAQLERVEEWRLRRKAIVARYDRAFAKIPEIRTLQVPRHVDSAYHIYPVVFRTERLAKSRDDLLQEIQTAGIGVGVHFRAIHLHSHYRRTYGHKPGRLPESEYVSERTLSLPLFPSMTVRDVKFVTETVAGIVERARR